MSDFQQLKLWVLDLVGLSKDAMHVHLGLLIFVLVAAIVRDRRRLLVAWALTALVALGVEALDLRDDWAGEGRLNWGASVHDVINTLVWPTLLALVGRRLTNRG